LSLKQDPAKNSKRDENQAEEDSDDDESSDSDKDKSDGDDSVNKTCMEPIEKGKIQPKTLPQQNKVAKKQMPKNSKNA
jgi:hypothetical protein